MKYDQLREKALANFELLLDYWGIEFKQINEQEYDFLSPNRADSNFGACRFNIEKGRGADFAGIRITDKAYSSLGVGFTEDDFVGFAQGTATKIGFDIIGLAQRVQKENTYKAAAKRLQTDLQELSSNSEFIIPARDAAEKRRALAVKKNKQLISYAFKIWAACEKIEIKNSPAEVYFKSRGLEDISEKTIRYHPAIKNRELQKAVPTILFKVQEKPNGELVALHRIYLQEDGTKKANVSSPKMALARIMGSGIWFGEPSETLAIVEGPENALTAKYVYNMGFVVCSISAANFSNLTIPKYVRELVLLPDDDAAGLSAYKKAVIAYRKQGVKSIKRAMLDWHNLDGLVA